MSHFKILLTLVSLFISSAKCCGKYGGGGGGCDTPETINAAVISKHVFKTKDVPSSSQQADIPTIVIDSGSIPLKIQMGSSSSDIEIDQSHSGAKGQTKYSSSVDGAIVMKHYVKKPIIQYVYEKIVPQRKIVQEVLPVKEFIKTIVSQSASTSPPPDTTPKPPKYQPYYYKKKPPTTTAPPSTEPPETTTDSGDDYMDYFF